MKSVWERALQIIPGGNQIYSKRPTRYCDGWPSHYTWARGNQVTATDGKTYTDMSTMGIGCCTLGYGDPDVDAAVIQAIAAGQFSSLNCIEELELAEELLKINKKMDMVKFARTGGEACMIAARIAKMANKSRGRQPGELYLQHGYSGWALGNPERGYGMNFDSYKTLELMDGIMDDVSFIIMEPVRNHPEESGKLLKYVRKFATEYNIPLIFDEITSGFRMNLGGYHVTKDIYPDIAVYGKALGNGYPISCVVGTREIMQAAEETFISSTFWSERIGFTAGLATLDAMKRRKCQDYLIKMGLYLQDELELIGAETGMDIKVSGIPPLTHWEFKEENNLNMSLYSQELLKKGYLAGDLFYSSMAHTKDDLEKFVETAGGVINKISRNKVKLDGQERDKSWQRSN